MTTNHEMLIGGLNEKELINADYMETTESGLPSYRRVYDSSELGYMHDRTVQIQIMCYKRSVDAVIALMPIEPTNLTSIGGKLNNGGEAPRIQWGSGYVLDNAPQAQQMPGGAYVKLTFVYKKRTSEAEDSYPPGLTVTGTNGIYSVVWKGTAYQTLDNGQGSNGADGLQFVKMPRRIDRYIVTTSINGSLYQRTEDRHFSVLSICVDGVQIQNVQVLALTETIVGQTLVGSGTVGEALQASSYGDTTYAASLSWEYDATTCRLVFCGQSYWIMGLA